MMGNVMEYYTVDQVAALLGLHVKTVRGYVRDGRLPAVRIGKQYRIGKDDLAAFTGLPAESMAPGARREVDVSSVVRIDGIGRADADRVTTTVTSSLKGAPRGAFVECAYDEERGQLKVVVLGGLETSATVLTIIDTVLEG
ncbi:helix-turn-helix domain-containing protein [Nonomuraea pusilla]|uniref:helix-turn-helix domain-containing protein n=2 Tax=Nonomuraea pusilla TaxID=46177 RepID=UPI0033303913